MDTRGFSIEEALSFGWSTTKSNLSFFVVLALISLVIFGIAQYLASKQQALSIVAFLVQVFLEINWVRIGLKFVDGGEQPTINDLFAFDAQTYISVLIAAIVVSIVVGIGFVLLLIPGIYLSVRLAFYLQAIIDQKVGPIESLSKSFEITKGYFWQIFGLGIVLVVVNIIGAIPLGLGLLVTVPMTALAGMFAYRRLAGVTGASPSAYTPV